MTLERVLQLGDPRLRAISESVGDIGSEEVEVAGERLRSALESFRSEFGFGRAVSAPQLGILKRMIALNPGDGTRLVVNPEIVWRGTTNMTMWDDCMSFPSLLVRLERSESITVRFLDERGDSCIWEKLPAALSELFQHEIDHLDGVLAIDRRLDGESLITRTAFDSNRAYFERQVDYVIGGSSDAS